MNRRSFIKGLIALASAPAIGKYVNVFKTEGARKGIENVASQGVDFFNMVIKKVMDEGTLVNESAISLSTVLRLIVKLKIGSPPTILLVKPPSIDFKIDGTPGKQNTFSTLKPGAPLVGFKIKLAFSGIQTIFCLPSLNSPGL